MPTIDIMAAKQQRLQILYGQVTAFKAAASVSDQGRSIDPNAGTKAIWDEIRLLENELRGMQIADVSTPITGF